MKRIRPDSLRQFIPMILLAGTLSMITHDGYGQPAKNSLPEDLRIRADMISYSGTKSINLFGKQFIGSTFSLRARVRVQTSDAVTFLPGPDLNQYEVLPAEFELIMVDDRTKAIHDELVEGIYDIWSKNKLYSGDCSYHYSSKDQRYVLTTSCGLVNRDGYIIFWVNGNAFRLAFIRFINRGGFGVMDSFIDDNLRISLANAELKLYSLPFSSRMRKDFLKVYEKGFFKH